MAAAAATLTSCAGPGDHQASGQEDALPTSTADWHGDGEQALTDLADLRWSDADRRECSRLATTVMRLFGRPDVPAERWFEDLSPLLTSQAQESYSYTDPVTVPVKRVTGPATVTDLATDLVAIVHVPTDAGLYAVTLTRGPAAPQWRVDQIRPPEHHVGD